jgi:hypothetical protein
MDTSITRRGGADRPNIDLAAAVDQALAMLDQEDKQAAARFLEGRHATFALICRVLTEPGLRAHAPLTCSPPPVDHR